MTNQRDPRIDPLPGDAITRDFATAKGGCIIREVERAHGGFVAFYRDNGYTSRHVFVSLFQWRRWASKAAVLAVAEKL